MPLAAFPKCFLDDLVVHHTMTAEQWIEMAADHLDIDGLEMYYPSLPSEDAAAMAALKARASGRGLSMPMMCYSPDFTKPTAAERREEIEQQKAAIRATAQLGGQICRVLGGQRRPGISVTDGIAMASECITSLIPFAKSEGIVLALENHYKDGYWEYPEFAQKADVFLALLASIPESPWFGVNYDPSNAVVAGDDPIELLEQVKHRVVSMHASDRYFEGGTIEDLRKLDETPQGGYATILKHGIIGRGMNDYDRIFTILKSVGFTGWISIEDGQDPVCGMEHLRLSAEFLRTKMKEHELT